jgi:hypothetical protein
MKPHKLFNLTVIVFCLLTAYLMLGCSTHISPWERGNLAKEHMAITTDPARSGLRDHVFTSKEASQGGYGAAGGGCGCN